MFRHYICIFLRFGACTIGKYFVNLQQIIGNFCVITHYFLHLVKDAKKHLKENYTYIELIINDILGKTLRSLSRGFNIDLN